MTLIFFHKNKFILTEFPWLVKDLQRNPDPTDFDLITQRALMTFSKSLENSTEKSLQILAFRMAEVDRVVCRVSFPNQKLDLPPSIHCGRNDDLLKKVPAHMMGATEGEQKAPSL